jgi:hypothetical protein
MLSEVRRESEIRRAMKPRDETFDDRSRDEFKRAYAREDFRRKKTSSNLLSIGLNHL